MSSSIDDITGEVVLFCRIFIKHEEISRFLGMLEKMKVQVQSEPGTLEYSWALDEKENEILLWERYTDAAAFRAHSQSDVFKAFAPVGGEVSRQPPIIRFYSTKLSEHKED